MTLGLSKFDLDHARRQALITAKYRALGGYLMSHHRSDLRISWDTKSSAKYSTFSSSPLSYCTADTPLSMSPIAITGPAMRTPSPKPLDENPDFVPIDEEFKKRFSYEYQRPIFENPRRTPEPPRRSPLQSTSQHNIALAPRDVDVCDEAEDFLQFLSEAGFMDADRRASSVRRDSVISTSSIPESRRGSIVASRRISGTGTGHTSRPSSLVIDSRRTSLALRRGSSGVLPPILRDQSFIPSSSENEIPLRELPPMQREDTLSKLVSHMRMSSDFSLASASRAPPSGDDESLFLARKKSSLDFTDLEIHLARARNPVLTQLHRSYSAQFEAMAQQIATLNRQVEELKRSQTEVRKFDRQISFDVYSTAPSEITGHSRQVSRVSSTWRATPVAIGPVEPPFWRDQLQRAGEEWDQGGLEGFRRESLRCISPMTRF